MYFGLTFENIIEWDIVIERVSHEISTTHLEWEEGDLSLH